MVMFEKKYFEAGQKIVKEGEPFNNLYCLFQGRAAVTKEWHPKYEKDGPKGLIKMENLPKKSKIFNLLESGDMVGEEFLWS